LIGTIASVFLSSAALAARLGVYYHPERRFKVEVVERIRPFAGTPTKALYMDKDELWRAMNGLRGFLAFSIGAAAINEMARRIARKNPDARTAAKTIFFSMIEFQVLALFLPLEALACRLIPVFPRALAGTLVRLYCDLASMYAAAESIASID
jgi:hypothetical protein